jgi:hypothetical protein
LSEHLWRDVDGNDRAALPQATDYGLTDGAGTSANVDDLRTGRNRDSLYEEITENREEVRANLTVGRGSSIKDIS